MAHEIIIKDLERARVEMVWDSSWTVKETESYFADLKHSIGKLNGRPWTCIIDQRNFRPATQDAADLLTKTGKWVMENGLDKAGIVVGSAIAKLQMTRMSIEAGTHGKLKYVLTEDEAVEFVRW